MSATRPAIVFSIGIMARSALRASTALKASSKVAQGNGSMLGYMLRQAVSELAPGSPWNAILLVFMISDLLLSNRRGALRHSKAHGAADTGGPSENAKRFQNLPPRERPSGKKSHS